jgi:hypothetical protein
MTNVPSSLDPDPPDSPDAPERPTSRVVRAAIWIVVAAVLFAVFIGYEQVELLMAWVTAKLC